MSIYFKNVAVSLFELNLHLPNVQLINCRLISYLSTDFVQKHEVIIVTLFTPVRNSCGIATGTKRETHELDFVKAYFFTKVHQRVGQASVSTHHHKHYLDTIVQKSLLNFVSDFNPVLFIKDICNVA